MIATNTMVLSKQQTFWHYSIIPFLLLVPIFTTVDVLKVYLFHNKHSDIDFFFGYIWLAPAFTFYFIQKHRLKFKIINVSVDSACFEKALQETINDLEWSIHNKTENFISAWSALFPRSGWGELVTIIKCKDKILINSICNPDLIAAVTAFGMNKLNVKTFERHVRECAQHGMGIMAADK